MQYQQAKHLKPAEFKRFWGVKLETFKQMVEIVRQHEGQKKKTGRPGKISLEDQILMTLEYWRECRLKIFKILADRYRNRRKRFGLRFNLIAGLYNHELRLSSAKEISKCYR
jgi:hypothetical protein